MSAVLGIVNGHNGILNLYSEKGKGTVFKIAFPVSLSADAIVTEPQHSEETITNCSGKVLVIDDEEDIRQISSLLLEDMGYSVVSAEDGKHGLEVFQKYNKELVGVILDMTMPRMNGEDCFHALQNIASNVPVILSSGYSEDDATSCFQAKELAGFIQKPYQINHFKKIITECFSSL